MHINFIKCVKEHIKRRYAKFKRRLKEVTEKECCPFTEKARKMSLLKRKRRKAGIKWL